MVVAVSLMDEVCDAGGCLSRGGNLEAEHKMTKRRGWFGARVFSFRRLAT